MARLLARRDQRGAPDNESEESPPAGDPREHMIRQNEANSSKIGPTFQMIRLNPRKTMTVVTTEGPGK